MQTYQQTHIYITCYMFLCLVDDLIVERVQNLYVSEILNVSAREHNPTMTPRDIEKDETFNMLGKPYQLIYLGTAQIPLNMLGVLRPSRK